MAPPVQSYQRRDVLDDYMPIYTRSLMVGCIHDFDLYVFNGHDMVLFRSAHLPLASDSLQELVRNNMTRLYISRNDRSRYQRHLQTHIGKILADPSVDEFTKASIVYDSSKEIIRDVFSDPTKGDSIKNSQAMVETTVQYVLEGQNTFHNMLRVMSFDYTIYSHSVNVCTFALALAQASGIDRTQELIEVGTGALLHDVGKARIPEAILYKPGPLDSSEWQTMRLHPQWGVEIVSETDMIPEASYLPISQHHERQDGSGYPVGLSKDDIHVYGRIVAIADAFDAMTTNRVYRQARESFTSLKNMAEQSSGFDQPLLQRFIQLMGPARPDLM